MSTKVLVTGAAGRLGRDVAVELTEAGFDVLANDSRYRAGLDFRVELADLLDPMACYRLIEGCDAVVHLANYSHIRAASTPQKLYRENLAMDVNVFQAAVEMGVRKLVFASSVQAFGGDRLLDWFGNEDNEAAVLSRPSCLAYLPIDGDAPPCPANLYGLSKVAGEDLLRFYAKTTEGLSATTLRLPYLMRHKHTGWLRSRRDRFKGRLLGNPDEGFSFLFTDDAGRLVAAILERQGPGYHSLCPTSPNPTVDVPIPELLDRCYRGVPLKVPAEELTSLVDISGITATLGWTPRHTTLTPDQPAETG